MLEKITNTFSGIFQKISGKSTITEKNIEDAVEEIKMALLEADVNLRVVRRFVNSTIEEAKGEKVLKSVNPGQQFTKIIYDKMVAMLGDTKTDLHLTYVSLITDSKAKFVTLYPSSVMVCRSRRVYLKSSVLISERKMLSTQTSSSFTRSGRKSESLTNWMPIVGISRCVLTVGLSTPVPRAIPCSA